MKTLVMKFGWIENNMGDMLNVMIPKDLFGYEIKHVENIFESESTGIGSYLGDYFVDNTTTNLKFNVKESLRKIKYYKTKSEFVRFWSTGFIAYPTSFDVPRRSLEEMKFSSVRGELSKNRIEKAINKKLDITTGDAGLLACYLVKNVEKKYRVGIIPHFREKNHQIFTDVLEKYPKSTIIDLGADPYEVIKRIGECEFIVSSSLHGLIVADSFGIPNIRVTITDKLLGDGFKFDDYYSSFGVKSNKIQVSNVNDFPSINQIIDNYNVNYSDVEIKHNEIEKAFYKYIK